MDDKGRYSGNYRLDPSTLVEPDHDSEATRKMWLEDMMEDPEFEKDVAKKVQRMRKKIATSMNPEDLTIHTVGESHIDCAWLWRYEQTRQKAIITFRKAVTHARLFPGKFNYALSEPLLLTWVKEDDPALFDDIVETVKSGGIELVGGAFVEPDCMMPSGEAFVRQRLYGMRFYHRHFGVLPKIEWFLDSFGYNWGLPQILAKSGAEFFWTSKITWNYDTTFPLVYFWWEGPDGTRLLTSNFKMGFGLVNDWKKYDGGRRLLKPDGKKVWDYSTGYEDFNDHIDRDSIVPHVGNFFGKGDGGHGPTHEEVARMMIYEKLGFIKWSSLENFANEIKKVSDRLPVWKDELYLENHRGTFSVHAEVKRYNRKFENDLLGLESLSTLAMLSPHAYEYPRERLEKMWKVVLRNQFHDTLPGSSIPEVYDDCWDDWGALNQEISEITSEIGVALGETQQAEEGSGGDSQVYSLGLYNPVFWDRDSPVFIPLSTLPQSVPLNSEGYPPYAILTTQNAPGQEFICQPAKAEPEGTIEPMPPGWWVKLTLPKGSLTSCKLKLLPNKPSSDFPSQSFTMGQNSISNSSIAIRWDPGTGALTQLTHTDINENRNFLKGKSSNLTFAFKDNSKRWPAWNLTPKYWKYPIKYRKMNKTRIEILEQGPVFTTVAFMRKLGKSPVTQKLTMFADSDVIYLQYLADWKKPNTMLKLGFETATNAEIVTADIAYAAIQRSTRPTSKSDKARYEKICHKYIDLSTPDNSWGLAILNEGKYAFDATGEKMKITMLRSPKYPGPSGESWAKKERLVNIKKHLHAVPTHSGLGHYKARLALYPHKGGALVNKEGAPNACVKQRADEFNQPVIVVPSKKLSRIEGIISKLTPNVFIGTLKLNEWEQSSTVILRCVEGCGVETTQASIEFSSDFGAKIKNIRSVDLLERPLPPAFSWDASSKLLRFPIKKFEILTFELEL